MAQIEDERDLVPLLIQTFPDRKEQIRHRAAAEQWTAYGVVGGIWFDLIKPALVAEDQHQLQLCLILLEHLLADGSDLIYGAVHLRITPFLIPWQKQWGHLMGPLLHEDLAIARG